MSQQHKHNRYPGIRSFEQYESALFFGRRQETRELYSLIKVEQFVVLFSKSGLGKTSLLNAGVLPLLEQEEYSSVKVRFQNKGVSPLNMLWNAVKSRMEELQIDSMVNQRIKAWCGNRPPSLWEYFKACSMVMNYLPAVPILILDQFEEFFIHSKKDQSILIQLLADIIFGRVPTDVQKTLKEKKAPSARDEQWTEPLNWKLVFAIRSDRLSMLDNLSAQIPPILSNRYQLHPLSKRKAEEAILLPAQSGAYDFASDKFNYSDDALDDIINNLSNEKGEIESFQLQIICGHLEDIVIQKQLKTVEVHHIGGADGIKQILNNYYRNRIDSIGTAEEQQLATKLIEEGLIVDGARVSLAESIVTSRYNITDSLLSKLLATRLIKPENTHLGKAYEVSHDTLVAPILTSFKQRKLEEERLQRAQEKKEQEEKLAAQQAELEEEQRRRRQANRRTTIAVGFAILALIASIAAYILWTKAETATEAAVNAVKNREAQLRVSDSLRIVSDNARIEAERSLKDYHLAEVKRLNTKINMMNSSSQFKAEKELHTKRLVFIEKVLKNSTTTPEEQQEMEALQKQAVARLEELKDY
ncbi:MAG: hypothetical protein GY810_25000 [Aureispira sp.]|nr:hypothetical protein [Aureispira sp.]